MGHFPLRFTFRRNCRTARSSVDSHGFSGSVPLIFCKVSQVSVFLTRATTKRTLAVGRRLERIVHSIPFNVFQRELHRCWWWFDLDLLIEALTQKAVRVGLVKRLHFCGCFWLVCGLCVNSHFYLRFAYCAKGPFTFAASFSFSLHLQHSMSSHELFF